MARHTALAVNHLKKQLETALLKKTILLEEIDQLEAAIKALEPKQ